MAEIHKNKITLNLINELESGDGARAHRVRARRRAIRGKKLNAILFELNKVACSLENSFRASISGCGRPMIDGLFGPFRN